MGVSRSSSSRRQGGGKMEFSGINALLPREMLQTTLSLLSPRDLKSAVLVCKLWAEVGQVPALWSWVTFVVDQTNMESMPERMRLSRLRNVSKIEISAKNVSEDLMVAIAMHPRLREVETYPWFPKFSSVTPELFGQAFGNMQGLQLPGTGLSVEQLSTLCAFLAAGEKKQFLDLSDNRVWDIQPSLLATAFIRGCKRKFVPHGVAIFDALGEASCCTRALNIEGLALSGVDADVMAKEVSKMGIVYLKNVELTPQQATSVFNAAGRDDSQISILHLGGNQLSSIESAVMIRALKFLTGLRLQGAGLTTQQVEGILDAIDSEDAPYLEDLFLDENNLSHVDATKLAKVTQLEFVGLRQTKISLQQYFALLEGAAISNKLLYWSLSFEELEATPNQLQQLKEFGSSKPWVLTHMEGLCSCKWPDV